MDPRRRLTISVHYRPGPGALGAAAEHAAELAHEAGAVPTRMLVEPGTDEVVATLAYDDAPVGTGLAGKRR